jgi:hypothetical protein
MFADLHLTSTAPSAFQVAKAAKHIGPASNSTGLNSVLNKSSTAELDRYSSLALQSGFMEIERNGSRSVTYPTTGSIGRRLIPGSPSLPLDSFRFVLSTASSLAHGYAVASSDYLGATCAGCGGNLFD